MNGQIDNIQVVQVLQIILFAVCFIILAIMHGCTNERLARIEEKANIEPLKITSQKNNQTIQQ